MITIFIIAFLAAAADQLTKLWATSALGVADLAVPLQKVCAFVPGVLNTTYVANKGAAFGMLDGARWFFLILTVAVCAGGIWLLRKIPVKHWTLRVASGLILGGAVGNLIDRLFLGLVRDFLQFAFYPSFPVFNVADCCIVVGCILLAVYILFLHEKVSKGNGTVQD